MWSTVVATEAWYTRPGACQVLGQTLRRNHLLGRDHTLQPTALVHEAYLKLVGGAGIDWQDRAHFLGIAARAMRQVLVEHARQHQAAKRASPERPPRLYWAPKSGRLMIVVPADRHDHTARTV